MTALQYNGRQWRVCGCVEITRVQLLECSYQSSHLISPHLVSSHLNWLHFVRTERAVTGRAATGSCAAKRPSSPRLRPITAHSGQMTRGQMRLGEMSDRYAALAAWFQHLRTRNFRVFRPKPRHFPTDFPGKNISRHNTYRFFTTLRLQGTQKPRYYRRY